MKDLYARALAFERLADPNVLNPRFFDWMRTAVVFTVQDDVVLAADSLSDTKGGVSRIAPWIRLPFERVFVQWRAAAQFRDDDNVRPDAVYHPTWHGALLERAGKVRSGIEADDIIVRVVNESDLGAAPHAYGAIFNRATFETAPESAKSLFRGFWDPIYAAVALPPGVTTAMATADIQAETFLLPWLMAVINAPNLVAMKLLPRSTAAFPGRPHGVLVKHHTISLKISRVQQRRMGAESADAARARLHTVRGHFKVRKTGVFWWSDFCRGDPERGSITKDYSVAA